MTHATQTQDQFGDLDRLWQFPLRRGNSKSPTKGACLLDAVSWFEYGCLGDHPPCTCPVLAAYGRVLNDSLPDDRRQVLRSYIVRLVGTVDPPSEILRAEYALKRAIREALPIALDERGLYDHARHCAELSPNDTMKKYQAVVNAACAAPDDYVAYGAYAACDYAACAKVARTAADAAYVACAAGSRSYDVALSIFDGMLQIGRQADPILPARVKTVNDSFADCAQQKQLIP